MKFRMFAAARGISSSKMFTYMVDKLWDLESDKNPIEVSKKFMKKSGE